MLEAPGEPAVTASPPTQASSGPARLGAWQGPPATFGAAVWNDGEFLVAGNGGDGDAVFRLLERDGDEEMAAYRRV